MNPREIAERIAKDAKSWRVECRGELSTAEDAAFSMIEELAGAVKEMATPTEIDMDKVMALFFDGQAS